MEPLYFQSCEEVDTYFREGREHFNTTYLKKLAQVSPWFSRVQEQTWPLNSGTQQRGFRFGRGFFDPTKPWRTIQSERCAQDSCDSQPEKVIRPGTSSYFWDLLRKELESQWFCVEDLMYRLLPVEEVMQFEATNAIITKTVHEEFSRSSFIGGSGHKWGAFVGEEGEVCEVADDEFWQMDSFTGEGEGGFDTRYIYVKCEVADLANIAYLSLDTLEEALVDLAQEDESYRLELKENGIEALEIIVPEPRVARKMHMLGKSSGGYWPADTDFDRNLTALKLAVARVIGDYAIGYDNKAYRYNVDTAYNTALEAQMGYAFDPDDRATWPRLVRVPNYIEQPTEIGYEYVPNRSYKYADFGLSVCWIPKAIQKWRNPSWTGTGDVQMDARNYSGEWDFRRPDWECNRKRKNGFFEAEFRLGMQIIDPTIMHSFLHRLDHTRNFTGSSCPLKTYTPPTAIDNYVCQGVVNLSGSGEREQIIT